MSNFNLNDYIDVKERVKLFIAKYPEGSLRFEFKGTCEHSPEFIWGVAYAYRHPGDEAPAMGTAQELAAGRTTFTRGSELQNLETSAWGRAISALGIGIDKGIASRQEVQGARARQDHEPDPWGNPRQLNPIAGQHPSTPKQRELINKLTGGDVSVVEAWKHEHDITGPLSSDRASELIEKLLAEKNEAK